MTNLQWFPSSPVIRSFIPQQKVTPGSFYVLPCPHCCCEFVGETDDQATARWAAHVAQWHQGWQGDAA